MYYEGNESCGTLWYLKKQNILINFITLKFQNFFRWSCCLSFILHRFCFSHGWNWNCYSPEETWYCTLSNVKELHPWCYFNVLVLSIEFSFLVSIIHFSDWYQTQNLVINCNKFLFYINCVFMILTSKVIFWTSRNYYFCSVFSDASRIKDKLI